MVVSLGPVIGLMVVMTAKHFVADFLLQTSWIARGKSSEHGWLVPLLVHAGAHAVLTLIIALLLFPHLWWIAPAEFIVHAIIDRVKVIIGRAAHLDMSQSSFWWLFGFDQFLHQLTVILIVYLFLAWGPAGS